MSESKTVKGDRVRARLTKPTRKRKTADEATFWRTAVFFLSVLVVVGLSVVIGRLYRAGSQRLSVSVTSTSSDTPLWRVIDLPGKGKGVVAAQYIPVSILPIGVDIELDEFRPPARHRSPPREAPLCRSAEDQRVAHEAHKHPRVASTESTAGAI